MLFTNAYRRFSAGVHMFVPKDEAAFEKGEPTCGFGIIRYGEGSVYYGDIYFDGKNYNKWGFGRQDFLLSTISVWNQEHKVRRAFYIGAFDYRETDWIYGNGVLYYVDENNRPACFVKGFFEGLDIIGPYTEHLTQEMLPDGYTLDMEAEIDNWRDKFRHKMRKISQVRNLENLFIGDSYFDLWDSPEYAGEHLFYENFPVSRNLNLGIGGTCFSGWMRFLPEVTALPPPKRIFINLGFNGLHRNRDSERNYKNYLAFIETLKAAFPDAEYYLLNVVQSPYYLDCEEPEEQLNALTLESAKALGVNILDMRTVVRENGGLPAAFDKDGIHLNPRGYGAMTRQIKEIITK